MGELFGVIENYYARILGSFLYFTEPFLGSLPYFYSGGNVHKTHNWESVRFL